MNEDDIRPYFNNWDTDKNGMLNWDEFSALLDELIDDISPDEKTIAFSLVDVNNTGMISFEEFSAWWQKRGGP